MSAPSSSTAAAGSSISGSSKRAAGRELLRQRQKMLRQRGAHRERRERAELETMRQRGRAAASGLLRAYCQTVAALLAMGALLLLYVQPRVLFRRGSRKSSTGERLPTRSVLTLFPPDVDVQASLPRFFMGYAIATDANLPARRAVRRVAQQRRLIADPGRYNQKITFSAWEHADFQRQLLSSRPGATDHHCGAPGFEELYRAAVTQNTAEAVATVADALVVACLLRSGVADGFVRRTVTPLAPLTRGLPGVAAVRTATTISGRGSQPRIHSDLLFLPVLTLEQRKLGNIAPSTRLPVEMTKYLVAQRPTGIHYRSELEDFVREWEEFLYKVIVKEHEKDASKWVLWNAACSAAERTKLAQEQKLVATTCRDDAAKSAGKQDDDQDEEDCCSFYDPNLKPFIPRTMRQTQQ